MKSRTVAHSCPFVTDELITWKVTTFCVVFHKMVNDFQAISYKALREAFGF